MSKFYVPALALALVGSSAFGQLADPNNRATIAKKSRYMPRITDARPTAVGGDRDIIWSDDFSNANNWVLGTVAGASTDSWVIGTTEPSGSFAIDPIASTTAANGFALFDSDLLCSGNQEAFVQMANPVDLSGYPGVVLEFEQFFRRFRGDCFVDVSIDGTNWNEVEVNDAVDVNDDTGNPNTAQINLSAFAANQAQVWIRFRYFSTVAVHGAGGGCDYAWMVDDVAFTTLPDYELQMNYGYVSTTGAGEEYGRIPVSQLPGTLNVGAEVFNFGGQEQTNVVVTSTFTGPVAISEVVSNVGSLAAQTAFVTDDDVNISGLTVGEYVVNHTMTSDQIGLDEDVTNNTRVRNFEVTETLYSVDKIDGHAEGVTEVLQQVGTPSFTDNPEILLMNMYILNTSMTVHGMEIGLGPASRAGGTIAISLLDTVDVLSTPSVINNWIDGVESEEYTITAADVTAGFVTIDLGQAVTLTPGAYYACARIAGSGTTGTGAAGTDAEVYILDDLTVAQPGLTSALYIPVDFNEDGTEGPHFYGGNGTAWAIRLSSNPNIGVRENEELAGVGMFPNPSKGLVTISLLETGRHDVEVINTLGEIVMTNTITGTTTMDLSTLAKGVYSVRVTNGDKTTVRSVVLN